MLSLLTYFRPYRSRILMVLGALLLEAGMNALIPMSFKYLLDSVVPEKDRRALLVVVSVLVVAVVTVAAFGLLRDYLYAKVGSRVLADLRFRIFEHLQRLSLDYHTRTNAGEVLARFSTDLASVENAITTATYGVLPGLDVIVTTVLLFLLEWRLGLVALLVFPASLIGPRLLSKRASNASYRRRQDEAEAMSLVQENLGAQSVVKAFGLEKQVLSRFRTQNRTLQGSSTRVSFLGALLERTSNLGILLLQVVILGVGATMTFDGRISVGTLAAFQALFLTLSYSLFEIAQFAPTLSQASGGFRRIQEILGELPQVSDRADAVALPRPAERIDYVDVKFGYTEGQLNLDGVSLAVDQGQYVAFVGGSGSGKSTLLSLLIRFYDPQSGAVTIDGHDLRGVSQASLRSHLGVVFQESILFNTTVRENIRMANPEATDAEVEAAGKAAEIHDFLMSQPDGYDTMAGERGSRFSGGQRQRIAIARAMIRNPATLILDEATSALDPATEVAINATIARLKKGRTIVSVTHRLASAVDCDRIFVLKKGKVVEQGTHQGLLEQGGAYAELWRKQTGFTFARDGQEAHVSAERLRGVKLLSGLDAKVLEELAGRFIPETVPADRVVVHQGDPGDRFYIIVRGTLEATQAPVEGMPAKRPSVMQDGDYFGEIALLDGSPRTATVRTVSASVLLSLPRSHFLDLVDRHPSLREELSRVARQRSAATG